AIECERVSMSYGKLNILNNLNLTLPQGQIYGLLGPSGCGKTALLRCILGRLKISQGHITVLGKPPAFPGHAVPGKMVGYMPQDLALYEEFTISDTFMFFGRLHGLTSKETEVRIAFLIDFLELPEKNKLVKNLSGGQRRRVSLGAALLQKPQLLVLDEPTVGVDPVLRARIWQHLMDIIQDGKVSVIITTHYIEEARSANMVGLMRNGKLLAEAPPDQLMQYHQAPTLETVFLKLCETSDQSSVKLDLNTVTQQKKQQYDIDEDDANKHEVLPILHGQIQWKSANRPQLKGRKVYFFRGSRWKERYTSRSTGTTVFCLQDATGLLYCSVASTVYVSPILQTLIKHYHYNRGIGFKHTVANSLKNKSVLHMYCYDNDKIKKKQKTWKLSSMDWKVWGKHHLPKLRNIAALMIKTFIRMMRQPGFCCFQFLLPVIQISLICLCLGGEPKDLPVAVVNNETTNFSLVQHLLSHLDKHSINQVRIHFQVYLNQSAAFAGAQDGNYWGIIGFEANFTQDLFLRMENPKTDEKIVDGGSVNVWLDMTNQQIAFTLEQKLQEAFEGFIKDTLGNRSYLASLPVKFEDPIYGSKNPNFTTFIAPGAILSITFFLAVALTSLAFVVERKEGLLDRCWVAGVNSLEMMLAHLFSHLFTMTIQITLLLTFIFLVFKIPNEGSLALVIMLIFLQGITGISLGLVISAAIDDEQSANQVALGIFYPILVISGIIWPIECIPYPLRYLSIISPQTYSAEALRSILYRGWGFNHVTVWSGFAITLAWSTFFLILATIILKKSIF
uniref:ATP-binding cassette, sub-family H, member 1 n=1 Tax=Latimeria chalumnae TaxID=7897 RepID=H3B6Y9_LATCH